MKQLCSDDGCFREVDTEGYSHPLAAKCEKHLTDEERRTFKNWRKKQRHKANLKARLASPTKVTDMNL